MSDAGEQSTPIVPSKAGVDYAALYGEYWSRDDRWGSHSFDDPDAIAEQILTTCGGGSLLDVGCGMGLLVRTLLRRGVRARGVDVAGAPIEHANRLAPGCFGTGSILSLPFEDGSFETVVCMDVLEHIAEEDLERALAELSRVCARFCFVRVATTPDRDGRWHLTIRDRDWWLDRLISAGFRRHPLAQRVVRYEQVGREGWQVTLLLEKARTLTPAPEGMHGQGAGGARLVERDVTAMVGDGVESVMARVLAAGSFVRAGDLVLDASRGIGWTGAMLASATPADRVVSLTQPSVNGDGRGVETTSAWARERFAGLGVEFVESPDGSLDGDEIAGVPPGGFGVVTLFDLTRPWGDLNDEIRSLARWLEPGGRLIVDVPGMVDRERLGVDGMLIESAFVLSLERAGDAEANEPASETPDRDASDAAGDPIGGRLEFRRVRAREVPGDVRRTLLVLMRDPVGADNRGYRERGNVERAFPGPTRDPAFHVANHGRDMENPWLVRSMVAVALRGSNAALHADIARRTLERARAGSADEGAALCVLAYRLLEADVSDPAQTRSLLTRMGEYHARADATATAWRWRISNQFVSGLLLESMGELDAARDAYVACSRMDALAFSPLLASKTIDACFRAGLIEAGSGRLDGARALWVRGLRELERALRGDWLNVWGSPEAPLSFAMPDLASLIDAASRCAGALNALPHWGDRPGPAWASAHWQSIPELRRRLERAERTRDWLSDQRAWLSGRNAQLEASLRSMRERVRGLEASRDQAQRDLGVLRARGERDALMLREERQGAHRARREAGASEAGRRAQQERADRLEAHNARLREGLDWANATIQRLRAGNEFLRAHAERLREASEHEGGRLRGLLTRAGERAQATREAIEFWKSQCERARAALDEARRAVEQTRLAHADEHARQREAIEFWRARHKALEEKCAWLERTLHGTREHLGTQNQRLQEAFQAMRERHEALRASLERQRGHDPTNDRRDGAQESATSGGRRPGADPAGDRLSKGAGGATMDPSTDQGRAASPGDGESRTVATDTESRP